MRMARDDVRRSLRFPPRPEMLMHAFLTLHEQIQNTPMGVDRVKAARAAEAAALAAVPTSQQHGLLTIGHRQEIVR